MQAGINRQIVLIRRPTGMVDEQCFAEVEGEIPTPGNGQALIRVLCVGIDPAIRGWIDARGSGYLPALELGDPVRRTTADRLAAEGDCAARRPVDVADRNHRRRAHADCTGRRAGWGNQTTGLLSRPGLIPNAPIYGSTPGTEVGTARPK